MTLQKVSLGEQTTQTKKFTVGDEESFEKFCSLHSLVTVMYDSA
jgi:hypothetical protein